MKIHTNKTPHHVRLLIVALLLAVFGPVAGQSGNPLRIHGKMRIATGGLVYSHGDVHFGAESGNAAVLNDGSLKFDKAFIFYSTPTKDGLLQMQQNGKVYWTTTGTPNIKVRKTFVSPETRSRVSFPFNVNISAITYSDGTAMPYNTQYALAWYDTQKRARYGVTEDAWTLFPSGDKRLNAGEGYLLSLKYRGGYTTEEIDFPISSAQDALNLVVYNDKPKQLAYFKNSVFAGNESAGWNVIGGLNPASFDVNNQTTSYTGALWYWDSSFDAWAYAVPGVSTTLTLSPYTAFFLQSDGVVTDFEFEADGLSLNNRNPITARSAMAFGDDDDNFVSSYSARSAFEETEGDALCLSLTDNANAAFFDNIYLLFNQAYSEEYKPVKDGVKMFSATSIRPELWSMREVDEKLYSLSLSRMPYLDKREVKLGVSTPTAGKYTFALGQLEQSLYNEVVLFDKETGNETDLTKQSYSFNAAGKLNTTGRFALFVNKSVSGNPAEEVAEPSAYVNSGTLYMRNLPVGGEMKIYETAGRALYIGTIESEDFSMPLDMQGAYIVKITGENPCVLKVLNNK